MAEQRDERPKLTIIQGGLGNPDTPKVEPVGSQKGQSVPVLEDQSLLTKVRQALSDMIGKLDTNPENKPPTGKVY